MAPLIAGAEETPGQHWSGGQHLGAQGWWQEGIALAIPVSEDARALTGQPHFSDPTPVV